jgi:hypothetical protein
MVINCFGISSQNCLPPDSCKILFTYLFPGDVSKIIIPNGKYNDGYFSAKISIIQQLYGCKLFRYTILGSDSEEISKNIPTLSKKK